MRREQQQQQVAAAKHTRTLQQQQMAAVKHARTLQQQQVAAGCAIGGMQWQFISTEWVAQSPCNALKQSLENRGVQWSHGCTVLCPSLFLV
jgi:hypothetical protein